MTIDQLIIFIELAKTHSMSLTAENLLMSKANISKSISSLEHELDARLFFKSRRGSYLTPFGEQTYRYAVDALQSIDRLKEFTARVPKSQRTAIIAFAESYAFLLPSIMKAFLQQYEDTRLLNVISLEAHFLNQSIPQLQADICFTEVLLDDVTSLKPYEDDYFIYSFYEDILQIMVDKNMPWAKSGDGTVSIAQLKELTLLTFTNYTTASPNLNYPNFFETFLCENNLYQTTTVINCNNTAIIGSYLTQSHSGLLCDYYSIKDSIVFNSQKYHFLKIKPEAKVLHVVLINKNAIYFRFFNDMLYLLQNNFADSFPFFHKLNGTL